MSDEEEFYAIAFRIDPDATVREIAMILEGLAALDVSVNPYDTEYTRDGMLIEGDHPGSKWDAIVRWCSEMELIEIDFDLMSEWIEDGEAERWPNSMKCYCAP